MSDPQAAPTPDTLTKAICDATIDCLNSYADKMEAGVHSMLDGPTALRAMAADINRVLIERLG
jgi:hypothetical protein